MFIIYLKAIIRLFPESKSCILAFTNVIIVVLDDNSRMVGTNLMLLDNPLLLFLSPAMARILDPFVDRLLDDLLRLVFGFDRHGVLLLLAVVGQ